MKTEPLYNKILLHIFPILLLFAFAFSMNAYALTINQEDLPKSIQVTNPRAEFSFRIRIEGEEGREYSPGEKMKLSFRSSKDAYITIYQYDPEGKVRIIFPNPKNTHNFMRADHLYQVELSIPRESEFGAGYIQGIASLRPLLSRDQLREAVNREFPVISSDFLEFTADLRNSLRRLAPRDWVSPNILEYQVIRPQYPSPNTGKLVAHSSPNKAEVYLDGEYQGITPQMIQDVAVGSHELELVLPGYETWRQTIHVSAKQTNQIRGELKPIDRYGKISIYCNKQNARVFVDGRDYGKTPSKGELIIDNLTEGYHELTITKEGYQTWKQTIKVYGGETINVDVYLSKMGN